MAMYDEALTVVRTLNGDSDSFKVHQIASRVSPGFIAL